MFEPPCRGNIHAVEPARLTRGVLKSIHPKVESGPTRETTMRHRLLAVAAATALIAAAHIAEAGQITYSLQNYAADQAGSTLTGSITTDGNLGTLTAADIVAWTWTVTPPVGSPFTQSSGPGINTTIENLFATDTQLLLPNRKVNTRRSSSDSGDSGSGLLEYRREENNAIFLYGAQPSLPGTGFWLTDNPGMGGTDPWVIGVATSSVPEPSGVVLVSLGITGLLLARTWRRSSRKQCN